jgi:predicted metalloprotease
MRTDDFRPSNNVEDDRQQSASRGGMPGGAGGLGIGTVIVIGLISWYFGIDPSVLLNGAQILTGGGSTTQQTDQAPQVSAGTPTDATGRFVALVLGDTEDRWTEIFSASGRTYHPPKLRLFSGSEPTPCAFAKSAMGPFYCPRDQRIYLDTSFFDDMQRKFGACSNSNACKFSEAYVIAHEVGHHVQNELGILPQVTQAQQAASSKVEASSCRPTASPGSGPTTPSKSTTSSSRAMSTRPCRPHPRSATTGCKRRCRAMSCPTLSPTARRNSANAGSRPASMVAR